MTPAFLGIADPVLLSIVVSAITGLVAGLVAAPIKVWVETKLLRKKADVDYELARRTADVTWEFERRRQLREQIGQHHGRILSAVDAFSDRLENLTRHHDRGWLDDGRDEQGRWSDRYYFRSTVARFMRLMALVFAFEREAIFVDARVAEPDDTAFLIYARAIRFTVTDVRLFTGTGYLPGEQTDHFFTDDLRRMCSSLTADGREIDLDRLDAVLSGDHRLDPVMAYFHGLAPRTLKWDRLFALQMVLLAFMNDFGHPAQHSGAAAFAGAAAQMQNITVIYNLRTWLPRIGGGALPAGDCVRRALDARLESMRPTTAPAAPALA